MSNHLLLRLCAAAAGFGLMVPAVHAAALLQGSTISTSGVDLAMRPDLNGVTLASQSYTFSSFPPPADLLYSYDFTVQDSVVRTTAGTLDFYFEVSTANDSQIPALNIALDPVAGFTTDVDWRSDLGGTVAPYSISRTNDTGPVPPTLFEDVMPAQTAFYVNVNAGQSSRYMFIHTNATAFDDKGTGYLGFNNAVFIGGVGGLFDGYQSFNAYEPVTLSPTPEPVYTPLLAGLLLLGVWQARRSFYGCRI